MDTTAFESMLTFISVSGVNRSCTILANIVLIWATWKATFHQYRAALRLNMTLSVSGRLFEDGECRRLWSHYSPLICSGHHRYMLLHVSLLSSVPAHTVKLT